MADLKTERSTHQAVRDRLARIADYQKLVGPWLMSSAEQAMYADLLDYRDLIEALLANREAALTPKPTPDNYWEEVQRTETAANTALQKFGEGR